jgi:hypothetical protein
VVTLYPPGVGFVLCAVIQRPPYGGAENLYNLSVPKVIMSLSSSSQHLIIAPEDAHLLRNAQICEVTERIQLLKLARLEKVGGRMSGLCVVHHLSPNFVSFDTSLNLGSGVDVVLDMGGITRLHGQVVGRIKNHYQMALTESCDPRRIILDEVEIKGAKKSRKARFSIAKPIAVQTKFSVFPSKLLNISTRGARFSLDRPLNMFGSVKISANGCDVVAGDITWKSSSECGVKFRHEMLRDELARWLA